MATKFTFDTEFTLDGAVKNSAPKVKRSYRADEVEALKAIAFNEGQQCAIAEAQRRAACAAEILAAGIHQTLSAARMALDVMHDDATRLASTISKKFVSRSYEAEGETHLEKLISDCVGLVQNTPFICINIPANLGETLSPRLRKMAESSGLSEHIRINAIADTTVADCTLDWNFGGAEISLSDALQRMDQLIEEHIATCCAERAAQTGIAA